MAETRGLPGAEAANGLAELPAAPSRQSTATLALGAVGIVYGDIGTSPIYALRAALKAVAGDAPPQEADVLGILSVIFWSLTLVVAAKYAVLVLRADNHGEGGTLAIMALARRGGGRFGPIALGLGILGASLFFGDALITPAISVLSAVEGLKVAAPALGDFVIPITVVIIVGLFSVQRFGTGKVAAVFGPVTALWFLVLTVAGMAQIWAYPAVLQALSPAIGAAFLWNHSAVALIVLGAAFLAVTGAEALYADLGHFGRRPIVLAWFALVFPALVINYFGQGAFILSHAEPVQQPLFQMMPGWATLPTVLLATMATIIASQATISGAYSLTRQAVQLHMLPRLTVRHTSEAHAGQIYMPHVNWLLMVGVLWLVLEFGSSDALAAAYGISVSGVMIVTVVLLFVVMRRVWRWPVWLAALAVSPFIVIDTAFLWANALKVADGGWVSLAVAGVVIAIMTTWRRGSRILFDRTRKSETPLRFLVEQLAAKPPVIVPGTAVFLTADATSAPTALLHSLKHYKVLHEHNVILTVVTVDRPRVSDAERVLTEVLDPLFRRVELRFGFMEQPNIPKALVICRKLGWKFDIMTTSFFLSRRTLKPSTHRAMPMWQGKMFIALAGAASDATEYFHLPTGRVVEIGTQVAV